MNQIRMEEFQKNSCVNGLTEKLFCHFANGKKTSSKIPKFLLTFKTSGVIAITMPKLSLQ